MSQTAATKTPPNKVKYKGAVYVIAAAPDLAFFKNVIKGLSTEDAKVLEERAKKLFKAPVAKLDDDNLVWVVKDAVRKSKLKGLDQATRTKIRDTEIGDGPHFASVELPEKVKYKGAVYVKADEEQNPFNSAVTFLSKLSGLLTFLRASPAGGKKKPDHETVFDAGIPPQFTMWFGDYHDARLFVLSDFTSEANNIPEELEDKMNAIIADYKKWIAMGSKLNPRVAELRKEIKDYVENAAAAAHEKHDEMIAEGVGQKFFGPKRTS